MKTHRKVEKKYFSEPLTIARERLQIPDAEAPEKIAIRQAFISSPRALQGQKIRQKTTPKTPANYHKKARKKPPGQGQKRGKKRSPGNPKIADRNPSGSAIEQHEKQPLKRR